MGTREDEQNRIRSVYAQRDREIGHDFYSLTRTPNLFIRHGQERAFLAALTRAEALPLDDKQILDIGCGRGQWLSVLQDFGAKPKNLAGIDLDASRLAEARDLFGRCDLRVGDASALPWPNEAFDVVFQSTVFTSILDPEMRHAVADEMRRVLRRSGVIVWYDFRYNNPRNPDVRAVSLTELRALFPDADIEVEATTLAPPLVRRLVPYSWLLASGLERLRWLNTHYIGVIRPR